MEFERRKSDETNSVISEVQFAGAHMLFMHSSQHKFTTDMLLMHSGLSDEQCRKIKHRVRKEYKNKGDTQSTGISFNDLEQFFSFIQHINDVDTALSFYHFAGASIDKVHCAKLCRDTRTKFFRQHYIM